MKTVSLCAVLIGLSVGVGCSLPEHWSFAQVEDVPAWLDIEHTSVSYLIVAEYPIPAQSYEDNFELKINYSLDQLARVPGGTVPELVVKVASGAQDNWLNVEMSYVGELTSQRYFFDWQCTESLCRDEMVVELFLVGMADANLLLDIEGKATSLFDKPSHASRASSQLSLTVEPLGYGTAE